MIPRRPRSLRLGKSYLVIGSGHDSWAKLLGMSQRLTDDEARVRTEGRHSGRAPKYPWRLWTDGQWHELWQFTDYQISTWSMQSYVHRYARYHGLDVKTRTVDEETLLIRFVTPGYDELLASDRSVPTGVYELPLGSAVGRG